MRKKTKRIIITILVLIFSLCFICACKDQTGDDNSIYIPETLVLNKATAEMNMGETLSLVVVDSQDLTLEWKSNDNNVAQVKQDGTVIAVGAGQTKITVTAKEQEGLSAECSVNVRSANGENLVKLDSNLKTIAVGTDFSLSATIYNNNGTVLETVEWTFTSQTDGKQVEQIIEFNKDKNTISGKGVGDGSVLVQVIKDNSVATCIITVENDVSFQPQELMINPSIEKNRLQFVGFPEVEYQLLVDGQVVTATFGESNDLYSLYLPDYLPEEVGYYKVKVGYVYKGQTHYSKELDYDTESVGKFNGFVGASSSNSEYIKVELDENTTMGDQGKSLKVTALANKTSVPETNRASLTVSFVNHSSRDWKEGVNQVSWKVYLDSQSFVDDSGNKINASEYVTPADETVNLINTIKYENALLGANELCIKGLSENTFLTVQEKGADKWISYTLNIDPIDFDKFFTFDDTNGKQTFKLAMFNTYGFLGFKVDETSDYIKSSGIGYTFYIDDMSFVNLDNDTFNGSVVGNGKYFSVELDAFTDFDGDESSLKVVAKPHTDNVSQGLRATDTAIYIPYSNKVEGVATVRWVAKANKTSFINLAGENLSETIVFGNNFYKCAMLTSNVAFFGENTAVLSCTAEDTNGWVAYTLVIPESETSKFFVEKDGTSYFKLVCMNTGATLLNNSQWVSATGIGYEFNVDAFSVRTVNGEFVGSLAGDGNYFALDYSSEDEFVTSADGNSLKVIAKPHTDNISQGLRATATAIYIPYDAQITSATATVTWKTKIDKSSFKDINGADVFESVVLGQTFYKNAMLTQNTAFFGANTATLSCTDEDQNGWTTYTLTISESDINKFFVEIDGQTYVKLVCMNTGATVFNDGRWVSATQVGYVFYVDEFSVSVTE